MCHKSFTIIILWLITLIKPTSLLHLAQNTIKMRILTNGFSIFSEFPHWSTFNIHCYRFQFGDRKQHVHCTSIYFFIYMLLLSVTASINWAKEFRFVVNDIWFEKNLKVWNVYSTFHILHELLIQHTERFIHLFEWYLHWIIKIFDRTTLQLIDNTISIRYQLMAGNLENLSFQNEAQYFSIIERLLLKQ